MDILAARVRSLRESRDWTQEDLARESGLKRPHISLIETRERIPGADTLAKLASALSTSADYLLGLTDFPGITPTPDYPPLNDVLHDPLFLDIASAWPDLTDEDRRVIRHHVQGYATLRRRERGEE